MRARTYLIVSETLFGLVSLLHLLRVALGWPFQLGPWAFPPWTSVTACAGAGLLSIWAFRLAR